MGWHGPLTHRQFICWSYWLAQQWQTPTRDNFYQMQIASEIRRTVSKTPNKVNTNTFKIKFEPEKKTIDEETKKKQLELTKSIFMGFMTAPITIRQDGKVIETIDPPLVKRKKLLEDLRRRQREARIKAQQQAKKKDNGRKINRGNRRGRE